MSERIMNVLFLCTGNSARSILAESILNQMGKGRFRAYSAGSHPAGQVNPHVIGMLQEQKVPIDGLRSKSWDEFSHPDSPQLDFVITVCDKAAGEVCPVWAGQPMNAHWGIEDPVAADGEEEAIMRAFRKAYRELYTRISLFTCLPLDKLDRMSLQRKLDDIGKLPNEANES